MTLNESNFQAAIADTILVHFTASWSYPCQSLREDLQNIGVVVGEVDVDSEAGLVDQYDVKGIPTLILFRNSEELGRIMPESLTDVQTLLENLE